MKYELCKSFLDKYTDIYYEYNSEKKLVLEIEDKKRAEELEKGGYIKAIKAEEAKPTKNKTEKK
jgi:hypothetical protein